MGFFSNLDTEGYDRQYSDQQLLKRMAGYFRPYLKILLLIVILIIFISTTGALLPIVVSSGVDLITQTLHVSTIFILFLVILFTGIANWLANWQRRRLTVKTIADIELSLRVDTFRAAMLHDLSFYDKFTSGKILSRITSDTKDFGQVVIMVTDLFSQIIQSLILGVILVYINWRMSIILFIFLPVIFILASSFRQLARKVTRLGMRAMANVNSTIKETISGISIAKNFRQEGAIYEDFNEANRLSYHVNVRRGFVLSLLFPTLNALGGIAVAVLVYFGGLNVAQGIITAGAWFLFIQSLDYFFFPILNLSAFWAQIQNGLSAAERVFALIDAEPAVAQMDNQRVDQIVGEIEFIDVSFRYSEQEQILENFNLSIRSGETLALVGHTGAGKSSIAKLIARFYEHQAGKILIDGRDIRCLELSSYRQHLGIVSQIPFLFSGTIIENICYACTTGIDYSLVENLANQIGNGEWLNSLPNGLLTEVGERGSLLSMGQRQLVSLLRVLVQRPSIFILDEATASIDPFTEWQIQQALAMVMADTTSILIAHRLSTVKAADRIIVLEKGRIIEEGNHDNLMIKGGFYASLYNTYFRHQSLTYIEQSRQFKKTHA